VSYKIAIIGMGKIAHDQHVPVIAKDPDFELAGVVSQRGVYPKGVAGFRTAKEIYRAIPDLDAVAICTPPSVRHMLAREAMIAGKHVLIEKPPTPTLAELRDLDEEARRRGCVIFTAWHSQYNAAVYEARCQLQGQRLRSLDIEWKEDVRRWHPGQEWIWQAGGFGVFDPGINALSIVTAIVPDPLFVQSAELFFPKNRDTPIAAKLAFRFGDGSSGRYAAEFDWRQTGEQSWNISIETMEGAVLKLAKGGARLETDGRLAIEERPQEYEAIYRCFAELLSTRQSLVDEAPQRLVADAFTLGRRLEVEPFNE
jgi:D-galactose 1-dehydrogenase